jgi:hypothetical protein
MRQVRRNVIRTAAIMLTLVGATGIAAAQSRGMHEVVTSGEANTQGFVGGVPGNVTPGDYNGYGPNVYARRGPPIYNYDYRYDRARW